MSMKDQNMTYQFFYLVIKCYFGDFLSFQEYFVILTVVAGIICIIGLAGNTASLYVLSKVSFNIFSWKITRQISISLQGNSLELRNLPHMLTKKNSIGHHCRPYLEKVPVI